MRAVLFPFKTWLLPGADETLVGKTVAAGITARMTRSQREMRAGATSGGDERRLFFQVWDVPCRNSHSLTALPLVERKEILQTILQGSRSRVRYTDHVTGNGNDFFAKVSELNLEGIVSKRAASCYSPGRRTRDWLKIKAWRTYSVVVGGMQHDSDGRLEALLVGKPEGDGIRYDGRVEFGLGLLGEAMRPRFQSLGAKSTPFQGEWSNRNRTWLRPELRITIQPLPKRDGSLLRHGTFVRVER